MIEESIKAELFQSADVKKHLANESAHTITRCIDLISDSLRNGNKLLLCGNGGSAADAQHIAAEFMSLLNADFKRPALPAVALTTDTSFITANANDFGFDGIFERQVSGIGRTGDVLLGISTSGNSENVYRAMLYAKQNGMITILFTGQDGGRIKSIADVAICVPSTSVQRIQESHIALGHIICAHVEKILFSNAATI